MSKHHCFFFCWRILHNFCFPAGIRMFGVPLCDFAPVVLTPGMIKGPLVKRELAYHFGGYLLYRRHSRFHVTFNKPRKTQKLEFNSVNDRWSFSWPFLFFFSPCRKPHLTSFPPSLMPENKQHLIPSWVFRFWDNGDAYVCKCDRDGSWHSSPIHPPMELSWAPGCLVRIKSQTLLAAGYSCETQLCPAEGIWTTCASLCSGDTLWA